MTDISPFPAATSLRSAQSPASSCIPGRTTLGLLMRAVMAMSFCGAMVVPDREIVAKAFKVDIILKNVVQRMAS